MPHVGTREGMVRAIAVGEAPPPVQLTEYQIHPSPAALVLERHQQPRWRQQRPAVGKRLVEIARGMQDIGRDDQVVPVGLEALGHRVLLDVQHPVGDRGALGAEARLRVREEARGDVGVHVVEPAGRKLGQDAFGRRADSGTHLQHPQPPSLRQFVHERPNHVAKHSVRRPPDRRPPIQIGGRWLGIAEQQR